MKVSFKGWIPAAIISLPVAYLGAGTDKLFSTESNAELMRRLSDGSFLAGVLIAGAGLLVLVSSQGFFDLLGFGFEYFFRSFSKAGRAERPKDIYEYKERRNSKRTPVGGLLSVGGVWLILAFIFAYFAM